MSSNILFSCTALRNTGKTGILKPDSQGYYRVPLGQLNAFNTSGEFYTYEGSKDLFMKSGALQRRIESGCLKGEEGHPTQALGESDEAFARRCCKIEDKHVSHHIASVEIDFNSVKDANGKPVIAIMGEVKPCGVFGDALQKSFDNPREDVCFSIRAFSSRRVLAGVVHWTLKEIITWDRVIEPGISTARKYYAPTLEAMQFKNFDKGTIQRAFPCKHKTSNAHQFSTMESADNNGQSLLRSMGWDNDPQAVAASVSW